MSSYKNIIIGGGPSALQCAYFFEKHNIEYIILERNELCGSFFSKYPLSGNLISINKKNTGNNNAEYNLRHDWNSLITDDNFRFTEYSDSYYPKRECLVEYLNDFARRYKIKVLYNKTVNSIVKTDTNYLLHVNDGEEFKCEKLIIATGLSKMNIPNVELNIKDKIYHYGEYPSDYFLNKENLKEFENKSVLIFGGGNASYELGNIINEVASSITIQSRSPRKWALQSNYTGDIRSIYLPFMDTFILKLLNAINDFNENSKDKPRFSITQSNQGEKYLPIIEYIDECGNKKVFDFVKKGGFDKIIFCTGWKFDDSIFSFEIDTTYNRKYPKIKSNYESTNNNNLFFIGALMHSVDYRKTSGGFIHGFRYLIKTFIHKNYNVVTKVKSFKIENKDSIHNVTGFIVDRLNTSAALYQMFGYIGDIMILNKKEKEILYYRDIDMNTIYDKNFDNEIVYFKITLDYGKEVEKLSDVARRLSQKGLEGNSTYIHPVIKTINFYHKTLEIMHLNEEQYLDFSGKNHHYNRIYRLLKSYCF
jgi:hypothetical protein